MDFLQGTWDMIASLEGEIVNLFSPDWYKANWVALVNIIMIDVVLAGDNAIVVGLAASRVEKSIRNRVIFWGIAAAVVLRIFFAAITTHLLAIGGIMILGGGLLLLWVCWKMYRQIVSGEHEEAERAENNGGPSLPQLGFWSAVWTITLADVSMSLDNVLAVAGAAKGSTLVLVIGLFIAIVLMAVASRLIASLLVRYPWITWIGLLIIVYVAFDMIYSGSTQLACANYGSLCDWVPATHGPPTEVPAAVAPPPAPPPVAP